MLHLRMRFNGCVLISAALFAISTVNGCVRGPTFIPANQRRVVDRQLVDYPGGVDMKEVARGLTAPVDFEIDDEGTIIVAEGGYENSSPRVYGLRKNNTSFSIYPPPQRLPINIPDIPGVRAFRMYGPVGGIALDNDTHKIYVTHRDAQGNGVVTCFGYNGSHATIDAGLPCQGDFSMTDITIGPPPLRRLYYGVGAATNSGVVGLDNWHWAKKHGRFCDMPYVSLRLNGYHFMSKNPDAGLLGGSDLAVTGPFQPFGESTKSFIPAARNGTPTAAVYSCNLAGGGRRVEAHGIRYPRGIAFDEYGGGPYVTNDGMELRGTRPVKNDPDVVLKLFQGYWYGWPNYSADLRPIDSPQFQPPPEMAIKYGYSDVSKLIDQNASNNGEGLIEPRRNALLQGVFPSLSGASKLDFVPNTGPFREWRGSAIVALSGDRAPFATSGVKNFLGPVGFKVVRVDMVTRAVEDVVRNTKGGPASKLPLGQGLLERPWAVKFAPDGSLYILDLGQMDIKDGRERVKEGTGRIFILEAQQGATTKPATQPR
jgi:hypothetical protein